MLKAILLRVGLFFSVLALPLSTFAQGTKPAPANDWQQLLDLAKQEGKVVVSIPPSAELRKGIEEAFTKRFGIALELVPARGASLITRIVDESTAGVRYFDLHIGGTESIVKGFLPAGVLEPVEPWFMLPEVKDPKNWWGGYVWIDNAKRFVYSFAAYQTESLWHNSKLVKSEEFRSFDDLLNPKWQSKIGMSDPRTPGSGASMWSYMREIKGEEYLHKLVGQKLFLTRDLRLLADQHCQGADRHSRRCRLRGFFTFYESGAARQTSSHTQRRDVRHHRLRQLDDHQKRSPSKRHQALRQLVPGQGGTGGLYGRHGRADSAARCRDQVAQTDRYYRR